MSQFILDEQLAASDVLVPLQETLKVRRLTDLRPKEQILDDRVPEILLALKGPTFITIDQDFWDRYLCHPGYCILYFYLRDQDQDRLPELLRALLRLPEFRTRASRLGKVVRVRAARIDFWQHQVPELQHVSWPKTPRRRP